jgi:glyoxylase-like metal-dependent hydrolase (beta-lactamase superfamily II)
MDHRPLNQYSPGEEYSCLLASDITALKAGLAALHKPVLGVFITHAHPDHCNRGSHDYNHS